jgi:hypothetical protein
MYSVVGYVFLKSTYLTIKSLKCEVPKVEERAFSAVNFKKGEEACCPIRSISVWLFLMSIYKK